MERSADERQVRDYAVRFRRWLNDPAEEPSLVAKLLDLTSDELSAFVRLHDDRAIRDAMALLLDRSHRMRAATPRESVTFARFATRLSSAFYSGDPQHDVALEGDAWRELAVALLSAGDYSDANEACEQALSLYGLLDRDERLYERTHLMLTAGQIAHFLGESKQGLELTNSAATTFRIRFPEEKRDYLRARTIYATILVATQQYDQGLRILEECAEIAERANDSETLAYLVNNIGNVHAQLGNLKIAKECFRTALEGWTSLGLKAEIPRVHGGLALVLIQEGRYNEAISEHFQARSAYLELNMPVVAAEVTLYIIETLFVAGRVNDIPPLCAEAVDTFTRARLPREAAKALAYVEAAAQQGTLTPDDVASVAAFLNRLQQNPDEKFDLDAQMGGG